ncbi:hypothetical protein FKP32DRAFT_274313 [Trametes sanguinea]|nr:hypothetical protein FKP32DRAFT_274313 [Trametes sanguinea]
MFQLGASCRHAAGAVTNGLPGGAFRATNVPPEYHRLISSLRTMLYSPCILRFNMSDTHTYTPPHDALRGPRRPRTCIYPEDTRAKPSRGTDEAAVVDPSVASAKSSAAEVQASAHRNSREVLPSRPSEFLQLARTPAFNDAAGRSRHRPSFLPSCQLLLLARTLFLSPAPAPVAHTTQPSPRPLCLCGLPFARILASEQTPSPPSLVRNSRCRAERPSAPARVRHGTQLRSREISSSLADGRYHRIVDAGPYASVQSAVLPRGTPPSNMCTRPEPGPASERLPLIVCCGCRRCGVLVSSAHP